jgi:predicted homoserine dehydrogenase-like protein
MRRMNARIAIDRDATIAAEAFRAAGVPEAEIAFCATAGEAAEAWRNGRSIAAASLDPVLDLPFDVLVEASGQPEAGAVMAAAAIAHGKHVALVSKEVDSVVGPWLAATAAAKGLVCTPVDGDQPSLLINLVTWAETLDLEIIAAGKSSEYDFVYDPATQMISTEAGMQKVPEFESVWSIGERDVAPVLAARKEMVALPTVAVPDLCEMGVVANACGLMPDVPGFHAPIVRVQEVATVFDTMTEGGILRGTRRIDVFNCLRLPDEISFAGGVFVTVRCNDEKTWEVLRGKGHILSRTARSGLIWLPRHLLGLEAPISVLDAALHGRSSAGSARPHVDLVGRAGTALPAGHELAMGGHHHNIPDIAPELVPAAPLADDRPVPFYLLANRRLRRPVRAGALILLGDIEIEGSTLLEMRRAQDAMFA